MRVRILVRASDRGLSQDSIQEKLEDELLGFLLEISLCFYVLGLGLLVRFSSLLKLMCL